LFDNLNKMDLRKSKKPNALYVDNNKEANKLTTNKERTTNNSKDKPVVNRSTSKKLSCQLTSYKSNANVLAKNFSTGN
jgi:hypothetical protein